MTSWGIDRLWAMDLGLKKLGAPLALTVSVVVLALGLGPNLLLFNAIYATLWRPLKIVDAKHIVTVFTHLSNGTLQPVISGRQAFVLHDQVPALLATGLMTYSNSRLILVGGPQPVEFPTLEVNADYFRALQLTPLAGRFFGSEEDRGENVEERAVLVESAWRAYFGGDRSVLDRVLLFRRGDKQLQLRIVGVAPDNAILFSKESGVRPLLLLPIAYQSARISSNNGYLKYIPVLRVKSGTTSGQIEAQIYTALRQTDPEGDLQFSTAPLRSLIVPVDRKLMTLLYGASCLLLLLTCANLASVFLARTTGRTRENAIRMFLGASLKQLLHINFREALIVSMLGTTLALTFVRLMQPFVLGFVPQLQRLGPEALAPSVALVCVASTTCVAIALAVSLTTILMFRRVELRSLLAEGGREKTSAPSRWTRTLIVGQFAIVLTLLAVSGVILRSFLMAKSVNRGFEPYGVVTFHALFPLTADTKSAGDQLSSFIVSFPGVQQVAFAADPPIGPTHSVGMNANGGKVGPSDPMINFRMIAGPYFDALGAHLTEGRAFTSGEVTAGAAVVIINEQAVRLLFGGQEPLGRVVQMGLFDSSEGSRVVGVVEDMREQSLDKEPAPMAYIPYLPIWPGSLEFIVKTKEPKHFIQLIKSQLTNWDRGFVIRDVETLEDITAATLQIRFLSSTIFAGFATCGLLVACFGLYGTLAAQVERRRREIGLRIALGATRLDVLNVVLGDGIRLACAGALFGLLGAGAVSKLLEAELYQVRALDPVSYSSALALLLLSALLACVIPALKAAQQDPAALLKVE